MYTNPRDPTQNMVASSTPAMASSVGQLRTRNDDASLPEDARRPSLGNRSEGRRSRSHLSSKKWRNASRPLSTVSSRTRKSERRPQSISGSRGRTDRRRPQSISGSRGRKNERRPQSISGSRGSRGRTNRRRSRSISGSRGRTNRRRSRSICGSRGRTNRHRSRSISGSRGRTNRRRPRSISGSRGRTNRRRSRSISGSRGRISRRRSVDSTGRRNRRPSQSRRRSRSKSRGDSISSSSSKLDSPSEDAYLAKLPWVAMRFDSNFGPGRYAFCCMCDKWIQGTYHGDETEEETWTSCHKSAMAAYKGHREFRQQVHQAVNAYTSKLPREPVAKTTSKAAPPEHVLIRRKRKRSISPPAFQIHGVEEWEVDKKKCEAQLEDAKKHAHEEEIARMKLQAQIAQYVQQMDQLKHENGQLRLVMNDIGDLNKRCDDLQAANKELETRIKVKRDNSHKEKLAAAEKCGALKTKCEKKDKEKTRAVEKMRVKVIAEKEQELKELQERYESKLKDANNANTALKDEVVKERKISNEYHEMKARDVRTQMMLRETSMQFEAKLEEVKNGATECIRLKVELEKSLEAVVKNMAEVKQRAIEKKIADAAIRAAINRENLVLDALNDACEESMRRRDTEYVRTAPQQQKRLVHSGWASRREVAIQALNDISVELHHTPSVSDDTLRKWCQKGHSIVTSQDVDDVDGDNDLTSEYKSESRKRLNNAWTQLHGELNEELRQRMKMNNNTHAASSSRAPQSTRWTTQAPRFRKSPVRAARQILSIPTSDGIFLGPRNLQSPVRQRRSPVARKQLRARQKFIPTVLSDVVPAPPITSQVPSAIDSFPSFADNAYNST